MHAKNDFCRVLLSAVLWTVARQAPLSMGFFRQEYWSGLPFSSPGESSQSKDQTYMSYKSPALAVGSLLLVLPVKPEYSLSKINKMKKCKNSNEDSKTWNIQRKLRQRPHPKSQVCILRN